MIRFRNKPINPLKTAFKGFITLNGLSEYFKNRTPTPITKGFPRPKPLMLLLKGIADV